MKCLILLLCSAVLVMGCKEQYQTCPKRPLFVYTIGYDSIQIGGIIISQYEKGSNFSRKLADSPLALERVFTSRLGKDSFKIGWVNWNAYVNQYENFDQRYTISFDSNYVDVSNAVRKFNKTSINHPEPACNSPIIEASIRGSVVRDDNGIEGISLIKP